MRKDKLLEHFRISLYIGRVKNPNKNPIAEKAISELEDELLKQDPRGGPFTALSLATTVARLNSRIRYMGLSAREMYTKRDQFTHKTASFCRQGCYFSEGGQSRHESL